MENKDIKKIQDRLAEPFPEDQIEWRVQTGGEKAGKPWAMVLAYVNNRAIQQRLDDVLGIDGWGNEYRSGPDGGVICGITVKQFQLTKWDGSENTHIEPVKGGLSDSMKRSAVQWGIGRYLYKMKASYATFPERGGQYHTKINKKIEKYFYWNPPMLPEWALPQSDQDPIEWAYKHPSILALCKKNAFNQGQVRDAVIASNFDVADTIDYINQLTNKKV